MTAYRRAKLWVHLGIVKRKNLRLVVKRLLSDEVNPLEKQCRIRSARIMGDIKNPYKVHQGWYEKI